MLNAGITSAWQQSQERKNRDIHLYRSKMVKRSVVEADEEIKLYIMDQEKEEEKAFYGEGKYHVVDNNLLLSHNQWSQFTFQEKQTQWQKYFVSGNLGEFYLFCTMMHSCVLTVSTSYDKNRQSMSFTEICFSKMYS